MFIRKYPRTRKINYASSEYKLLGQLTLKRNIKKNVILEEGKCVEISGINFFLIQYII